MPPEPSADVSGEPLLQVMDLAGSRGDRRLFQGLNLSLQPGQVVWLRGRNGRGKTAADVTSTLLGLRHNF